MSAVARSWRRHDDLTIDRRPTRLAQPHEIRGGWAPAQHGTRSKYVTGCRCDPCTDAEAVYSRQVKAARRAAS